MKWLVTGGAGFIGSNFVFYMLDKYPEDQIICLDKLTYAGNLETLEGVMENPGLPLSKGILLTERRFTPCLRKSVRTSWSTLRRKAMWTAQWWIRVSFCRPISWVPAC